MKGLITKAFAVMLLGWYLIGIVGFNVHTCFSSGQTFVVTFMEGMTCEDIHPEHHSCCCGHSHNSCCGHSQDSCCKDEYKMLDLTGAFSQDDLRLCIADDCHSIICQGLCCNDMLEQVYPSHFWLNRYIHGPDPGIMQPEDIQSFFGIWRI